MIAEMLLALCTKGCAGEGAFNPAFADSPVTIVVCTVPDACRIGEPPKPGGATYVRLD